ncbi:MAG: YIP1 family protein [Ignavibacteriae bacterium]|nr:YIP1 family protein [Ignavibacteriota bacterium]
MNLVDRVKNIIMTPKTEWPVIAAEEANPTAILTGYVIPLAAVPAAATVIGTGLIGGPFGASLTFGIGTGIVTFITAVVGVYLTALVMDYLAPNFGSQKNFGRALQTVAYSYTPAWVGGILAILPAISWLGTLAGLYGLYLMFLGLPHTMKTPEDKTIVYMIVTIIVLVVIYSILALILGGIMVAILGFGAMGSMMQ